MQPHKRPRPNEGNKKGTLRQVWRDVTRKNGTSFRQRFYTKDKLHYDKERDKTLSLGEKVQELAQLEKLHGFYQPGKEKTLRRDSDGKKFSLREHINPDNTIGGWVSSEASVERTFVAPDAIVLSGNIKNSTIEKETVIEIEGDITNSFISESTLTGKTSIVDSQAVDATIHDSYITQNTKVNKSDLNDSIVIESSFNDAYINGARVNASNITSSDAIKGSTVSNSTISQSLVFASVVEKSEIFDSKVFASFVQPETQISMSNIRGADISKDETTGTPSSITGVSAAESVIIAGGIVELSNLNNVTLRRSRISNCSLANGSTQDIVLEDVNEIGQKNLPFILIGQKNPV